jgi:hypothetical protein
METEITRKVEDAVSTIVGIEHINSNISTGNSQTVIEFEFGSDLQQAMDDVRDAVSRIRPDLPIDATEPYIGRYHRRQRDSVRGSAENLSDRLSGSSTERDARSARQGSDRSTDCGVSREVRVDLDPEWRWASPLATSRSSCAPVELPGANPHRFAGTSDRRRRFSSLPRTAAFA